MILIGIIGKKRSELQREKLKNGLYLNRISNLAALTFVAGLNGFDPASD